MGRGGGWDRRLKTNKQKAKQKNKQTQDGKAWEREKYGSFKSYSRTEKFVIIQREKCQVCVKIWTQGYV